MKQTLEFEMFLVEIQGVLYIILLKSEEKKKKTPDLDSHTVCFTGWLWSLHCYLYENNSCKIYLFTIRRLYICPFFFRLSVASVVYICFRYKTRNCVPQHHVYAVFINVFELWKVALVDSYQS